MEDAETPPVPPTGTPSDIFEEFSAWLAQALCEAVLRPETPGERWGISPLRRLYAEWLQHHPCEAAAEAQEPGDRPILRVTILDTQTGETRTPGPFYDAVWWCEGNGSCDCNRAAHFGISGLTNTCGGCHRFLIVAVDPMPEGYTLRDFNEDYPDELLAPHLPA